MSPDIPGTDSSTGQRTTFKFTFVTGSIQREARSHAMREHWRRRRQHNWETKTSHKKIPSASRTLLPRSTTRSDEEVPTPAGMSGSSVLGEVGGADGDVRRDSDAAQREQGIPSQLLSGISYALSSSRPDPFQTCPVHLTSQHQKLLHHWISTHAAMMFENLDVAAFNPMKDVWFPLDLSNPSSFNCIMAHSAAHLSHLYAGTPPRRGTTSSDALKYKIEAVRILRLWLSDPEKELCDDAFAAVVRLLTFERYWGTVQDWQIHRDGLQRMINAKGGVETLHRNWRLELVVYLVSLMSRPSWFESTNQLEQISRPSFSASAVQSTSSLDIHKVRCLWLISFIQDMRTFMGTFYNRGLFRYPCTHTAVGVLRHQFQLSIAGHFADDPRLMGWEDEMLGCLFSISLLIQDSNSVVSDGGPIIPTKRSALDELESLLLRSQHMWMESVYNLRLALFECLSRVCGDGQLNKVNYVTDLVCVLGTLSLEARQGVEKCLLNLLYCLGNNNNVTLTDEGWTPDSLLSSMRGH